MVAACRSRLSPSVAIVVNSEESKVGEPEGGEIAAFTEEEEDGQSDDNSERRTIFPHSVCFLAPECPHVAPDVHAHAPNSSESTRIRGHDVPGSFR